MFRRFALMLSLAVAMTSTAEDGKFVPAAVSAAGLGRYRVEVVATEELDGFVSQFLAVCRCRLEPYAELGFHGFMIQASVSAANLMSNDPRVVRIEEIPSETGMVVEQRQQQPLRTATPNVESAPPAPAIVSEANATPWTTGQYTYDGAGNVSAIGNRSYVYDAFGRLTLGGVTNGTRQEYAYDRNGSLVTITTTVSGSLTNTKSMNVNVATNRVTTFSDNGVITTAIYDAVGRATKIPDGSFVYDAGDMVIESAVDLPDSMGNKITQRAIYLYTASDERVATIGIDAQNQRKGADWTIRDLSGKVLRRFVQPSLTSAWSWHEDYIYRDGQLLAAEAATGVPTLHFHLDHLGTPRLITGNGGARGSTRDLYPFGEDITPDTDCEHMKFTGHERDNDLVDYMHARYYAVEWGRFLSVDPVNSASPSAPQSWNRYSYARNNPVALVDRNGKWPTKVVHTHQNAIDFTLRTLPAADRQVLKQAQVTADLDQRNQYKHAMRNPGQSPHDAANLANKFIDTAMNRAVALEKSGNHAGALLNVGLAMHTLQDNTSPMHMGVQEFDPNKGNLSGATLGHVQGELYDPSGMPQHEGVGENLDRATYDVYAHFANASGLPVPPVPQCDGKPCFEPSGEIHVEVPPK